MRTTIYISGAVRSAVTLARYISNMGKLRELPFNQFAVDFDTVGRAREALKYTADILTDQDEAVELNGNTLLYDAAKAHFNNQ